MSEGPSTVDYDPSANVKQYMGLALASLEDFYTTKHLLQPQNETASEGQQIIVKLPANSVLVLPSFAMHCDFVSWVPGGVDQFVSRMPDNIQSLFQNFEIMLGGLSWVNINDYWLVVKIKELHMSKDAYQKADVNEGCTMSAIDAINTGNTRDKQGRPLFVDTKEARQDTSVAPDVSPNQEIPHATGLYTLTANNRQNRNDTLQSGNEAYPRGFVSDTNRGEQSPQTFRVNSWCGPFKECYPSVVDSSLVNEITVRITLRNGNAVPVMRTGVSNFKNDFGGMYDSSLGLDEADHAEPSTNTWEGTPKASYELRNIYFTIESISMSSPLYSRQVEQLTNEGSMEFQFKNYQVFTLNHRGQTPFQAGAQSIDAIYSIMQPPDVELPNFPVGTIAPRPPYNDNCQFMSRQNRFQSMGISSYQYFINQAQVPQYEATPMDAYHHFMDGLSNESAKITSTSDWLNYFFVMPARLNFPHTDARLLSGLDSRGVTATFSIRTRTNGKQFREAVDASGVTIPRLYEDSPTNLRLQDYMFGTATAPYYGTETQLRKHGDFFANSSTNNWPEGSIADVDQTYGQSNPVRRLNGASEFKHLVPRTYSQGVQMRTCVEHTSTLRIGAGRQAQVLV